MARPKAFRTTVVVAGASLAIAAGCSSDSPFRDLAVVGQRAPALALINEVRVNPTGQNDAGGEYIELMGTAGGSLANVYVVATDGSGNLTLVVNLGQACGTDPCRFGDNGLLVIGDSNLFSNAPAATTVVAGTALDDAALLDNTATSVVLLESTAAISAGVTKYSDLPNGVTVLDAVGFAGAGAAVYGGVDVGSDAVRSMSRTDDTATSAGSWYYCEQFNQGNGLLCRTASANAPQNPAVTPGDLNVGEAEQPVGAGGAGGAAGAPSAAGAPPAGGTSGATGGGPAPAGAGGVAGELLATGGTAPVTGGAPTVSTAGAAGTVLPPAEAGAAGGPSLHPAGGSPSEGGAAQGSGGEPAAAGTATNPAGGTATGGSDASGGSDATAGQATAGSPAAATAGRRATATGDSEDEDIEGGGDSGCGCRAAGPASTGSGALALLAMAMLLAQSRRRPHR